jgi:putative hydrolase of the HAD superfamily
VAIRAVIFDLGHTLWDFAPTRESRRLAVARFHDRLRGEFDGAAPSLRDLNAAMRQVEQRWFAEWDTDRLEQPPSQSFVAAILETIAIGPSEALVEDLTRILFGRELDMPVVEPDTLAAVAALHERGVAMGCVTNTVLLEEGIHDVLYRTGLRRYLRSVVVSSAMGYRKPHASLFQRALSGVGLPFHEALFVGDRLVDDVGGAQAVGMRAVLTHQYRQEALDGSAIRPDAVISRLAELPRALARLASYG